MNPEELLGARAGPVFPVVRTASLWLRPFPAIAAMLADCGVSTSENLLIFPFSPLISSSTRSCGRRFRTEIEEREREGCWRGGAWLN